MNFDCGLWNTITLLTEHCTNINNIFVISRCLLLTIKWKILRIFYDKLKKKRNKKWLETTINAQYQLNANIFSLWEAIWKIWKYSCVFLFWGNVFLYTMKTRGLFCFRVNVKKKLLMKIISTILKNIRTMVVYVVRKKSSELGSEKKNRGRKPLVG